MSSNSNPPMELPSVSELRGVRGFLLARQVRAERASGRPVSIRGRLTIYTKGLQQHAGGVHLSMEYVMATKTLEKIKDAALSAATQKTTRSRTGCRGQRQGTRGLT